MYLNKISHYNPPRTFTQDFISGLLKDYIKPSERDSRIIDMIYRSSAIDQRHSMVNDLNPGFDGECLFINKEKELLPTPKSGQRNDFYRKGASLGFVETARSILADNKLQASDITHVVTVSCTGFYAPGPDFDIVTQLGMSPDTERYHLGFMGCYAAFPALRMAESFLAKDKEAKVLVICLELCTLHLQFNTGPDQLLSGAIFADGAAGTICTSEPIHSLALKWLDSYSTLIVEGESEMAWTIGDYGFDMKLTTYVPKLLAKHTQAVIEAAFPKGKPDYEILSLHPGGKAIVDRVQQVFDEPKESLQYSREVLRKYGNMSSATILFVLEEVQKVLTPGKNTIAMGFGPGLTVETALLNKA